MRCDGGSNGSNITVSVQSIVTNEMANQTWSESDMPAYRAFQRSLLAYGERFFSEFERY